MNKICPGGGLLGTLGLALLLSACAVPAAPDRVPGPLASAPGRATPAPSPLPAKPLASARPPQESPSLRSSVRSLPGGLDNTLVFNSNSPELVKNSGILLSTWKGEGAHLDYALSGTFEVFLHHLAETSFLDGKDTCWLALAAQNDTEQATELELVAGASWLTGPDAPFIDLKPLVQDPQGAIYSGPGGRAALDFLLGRSNVSPEAWRLAAGERRLLWLQPIPAKNFGLPLRNGRSGIFRFRTEQAIKLASVALLGRSDREPSWGEVEAVLQAGQRAGPPDKAATPYEPPERPSGGQFIYGRVAGVSEGARWVGTLFEKASSDLREAGDWLGFPIATVALNTLGTGQVQAPAMKVRHPDSAVEAHGSYGVTYDLQVPLDNPGEPLRQYALSLSHPLRIPENSEEPPRYTESTRNQPVTFRGSVQCDWDDEQGQPVRRLVHLTLRQGERGAPFAIIPVVSGRRTVARLRLVYPADCTPPQLLTVSLLSR